MLACVFPKNWAGYPKLLSWGVRGQCVVADKLGSIPTIRLWREMLVWCFLRGFFTGPGRGCRSLAPYPVRFRAAKTGGVRWDTTSKVRFLGSSYQNKRRNTMARRYVVKKRRSCCWRIQDTLSGRFVETDKPCRPAKFVYRLCKVLNDMAVGTGSMVPYISRPKYGKREIGRPQGGWLPKGVR